MPSSKPVPLKTRLSQLRALATSEPDDVAWQRLTNALDGWPDDGTLELAIDYVAEHLDDWPDACRWAPWPWWKVVRHNKPEPRWRLVRSLGLTGYGDRHEVMRDLHQCRSLEQLTSLHLTRVGLTSLELKHLSRHQGLNALTELDLSYNDIGVDEALWYHLELSRPLQNLTHLTLRDNPIGDPGGVAIGRSHFAANLIDLNLRNTDLGPASIEALATGLGEPLRVLELSGNIRFRDIGARALARAQAPTGVESLHLNNCAIGPDGLTALLAAPIMRCVTWLDLCGNSVGVKGARQLGFQLRNLPNLTRLSLMGSRIGPAGAVELASSPWLGGLERLDLRFRDIGPDGARALASAESLGEEIKAQWRR